MTISTPTGYPAACSNLMTGRLAPRDLQLDLARIDERILRLGHALNDGANLDDGALAHDAALISRNLNAVIDEAREMPDAEDVFCGYEGTVAPTAVRREYPDVVVTDWTCPRCGAAHSDRTEADA